MSNLIKAYGSDTSDSSDDGTSPNLSVGVGNMQPDDNFVAVNNLQEASDLARGTTNSQGDNVWNHMDGNDLPAVQTGDYDVSPLTSDGPFGATPQVMGPDGHHNNNEFQDHAMMGNNDMSNNNQMRLNPDLVSNVSVNENNHPVDQVALWLQNKHLLKALDNLSGAGMTKDEYDTWYEDLGPEILGYVFNNVYNPQSTNTYTWYSAEHMWRGCPFNVLFQKRNDPMENSLHAYIGFDKNDEHVPAGFVSGPFEFTCQIESIVFDRFEWRPSTIADHEDVFLNASSNGLIARPKDTNMTHVTDVRRNGQERTDYGGKFVSLTNGNQQLGPMLFIHQALQQLFQNGTIPSVPQVTVDTLPAAVQNSCTFKMRIKMELKSTFQTTRVSYSHDSKKETGMVGINNLGATCYLNGLLQVLFHLVWFRRSVFKIPHENELYRSSTTLGVQSVFMDLQKSSQAVDTHDLLAGFGWVSSDAFLQQDCQEMLRVLMDKLEEKMKDTIVNDHIKLIFGGTIRSFISCVNVAYESKREEDFYDVAVNVKGCINLLESFRQYTETELLEGENQYDAGTTYGKQDAKKGVVFTKLPPVMTIHLKRFDFDMQRLQMRKIHDYFEFPSYMNLDEFIGEDVLAANELARASGQDVPTNDYVLHSVLVHTGDYGGGHYYAYIRPSDAEHCDYKVEGEKMRTKAQDIKARLDDIVAEKCNAMNLDVSNASPESLETLKNTVLYHELKHIGRGGKWFRFDDDNVYQVEEREAIEYHYGRLSEAQLRENRHFVVNNGFASAYMLLYVRADEIGDTMGNFENEELPYSLINRLKFEKTIMDYKRTLAVLNKQRITTFTYFTEMNLVEYIPNRIASSTEKSEHTFGTNYVTHVLYHDFYNATAAFTHVSVNDHSHFLLFLRRLASALGVSLVYLQCWMQRRPLKKGKKRELYIDSKPVHPSLYNKKATEVHTKLAEQHVFVRVVDCRGDKDEFEKEYTILEAKEMNWRNNVLNLFDIIFTDQSEQQRTNSKKLVNQLVNDHCGLAYNCSVWHDWLTEMADGHPKAADILTTSNTLRSEMAQMDDDLFYLVQQYVEPWLDPVSVTPPVAPVNTTVVAATSISTSDDINSVNTVGETNRDTAAINEEKTDDVSAGGDSGTAVMADSTPPRVPTADSIATLMGTQVDTPDGSNNDTTATAAENENSQQTAQDAGDLLTALAHVTGDNNAIGEAAVVAIPSKVKQPKMLVFLKVFDTIDLFDTFSLLYKRTKLRYRSTSVLGNFWPEEVEKNARKKLQKRHGPQDGREEEDDMYNYDHEKILSAMFSDQDSDRNAALVKHEKWRDPRSTLLKFLGCYTVQVMESAADQTLHIKQVFERAIRELQIPAIEDLRTKLGLENANSTTSSTSLAALDETKNPIVSWLKPEDWKIYYGQDMISNVKDLDRNPYDLESNVYIRDKSMTFIIDPQVQVDPTKFNSALNLHPGVLSSCATYKSSLKDFKVWSKFLCTGIFARCIAVDAISQYVSKIVMNHTWKYNIESVRSNRSVLGMDRTDMSSMVVVDKADLEDPHPSLQKVAVVGSKRKSDDDGSSGDVLKHADVSLSIVDDEGDEFINFYAGAPWENVEEVSQYAKTSCDFPIEFERADKVKHGMSWQNIAMMIANGIGLQGDEWKHILLYPIDKNSMFFRSARREVLAAHEKHQNPYTCTDLPSMLCQEEFLPHQIGTVQTPSASSLELSKHLGIVSNKPQTPLFGGPEFVEHIDKVEAEAMPVFGYRILPHKVIGKAGHPRLGLFNLTDSAIDEYYIESDRLILRSVRKDFTRSLSFYISDQRLIHWRNTLFTLLETQLEQHSVEAIKAVLKKHILDTYGSFSRDADDGNDGEAMQEEGKEGGENNTDDDQEQSAKRSKISIDLDSLTTLHNYKYDARLIYKILCMSKPEYSYFTANRQKIYLEVNAATSMPEMCKQLLEMIGVPMNASSLYESNEIPSHATSEMASAQTLQTLSTDEIIQEILQTRTSEIQRVISTAQGVPLIDEDFECLISSSVKSNGAYIDEVAEGNDYTTAPGSNDEEELDEPSPLEKFPLQRISERTGKNIPQMNPINEANVPPFSVAVLDLNEDNTLHFSNNPNLYARTFYADA
jgi:ubiquitin C-terminal hydrolase